MNLFPLNKLAALLNRSSKTDEISSHITTGITGEKIARKYLKRHKFRILKTNYSGPHGEIDIIAQEGPDLVFIEVKTRSEEKFFTAESAVDRDKQKHIIKTASNFIEQYRLKKWPCRYDIVAIILDNENTPTIRHTRDAFAPRNTPVNRY